MGDRRNPSPLPEAWRQNPCAEDTGGFSRFTSRVVGLYWRPALGGCTIELQVGAEDFRSMQSWGGASVFVDISKDGPSDRPQGPVERVAQLEKDLESRGDALDHALEVLQRLSRYCTPERMAFAGAGFHQIVYDARAVLDRAGWDSEPEDEDGQ